MHEQGMHRGEARGGRIDVRARCTALANATLIGYALHRGPETTTPLELIAEGMITMAYYAAGAPESFMELIQALIADHDTSEERCPVSLKEHADSLLRMTAAVAEGKVSIKAAMVARSA